MMPRYGRFFLSPFISQVVFKVPHVRLFYYYLLTPLSPCVCMRGWGWIGMGTGTGTRGGVFFCLFFLSCQGGSRAAGQGGFYSLPLCFLFSSPDMCIMKTSPFPPGMIFDGGCLAVCLASCRDGRAEQ
ncbi:hypothetical protein B0T24DRAFT_318905 [Lasiosphaeria ovina]|uniref:Uncharacterized protein n=1 Tax=Lasiosphaeria ovina TaxID=92902 RepID=A0AAE0K7C6_9PEZI|nr:hypothetical protein B0T24DRAFT_318905 [Lasiosphaeria ovina]